MRIDCSEPEECGCVVVTCYHCRTSGMLNTQESEPSNVIASSVTSMPASSRPVQALGHDSAAIGSTSTSSPVRCSSPIRSGTLTPLAPPDITSVSSEPTQSVGPNNLGSGASVSSAPIQAVGPTSFASMQTPAFGSGASASKPSIFESRQAPDCDSSGIFGAPKPSIFGKRHDCDSCGIFGAPKSSIFGAPTPSTSAVTSVRSAFAGPSPPSVITSVSSGPAIFGTGAFGVPTPSIFGSMQASAFGSGASVAPAPSTASPRHISSPTRFVYTPSATLISSAPTQSLVTSTSSTSSPVQSSSPPIFESPPIPSTFGSTKAPAFGAPTQPFGSMQAPSFGSAAFGAPIPSTFGSTQGPAFGAPTQPFRSIQAPSFGSGAFGAPTQPFGSTLAPSFGSCTSATSISSTFGSMQAPAFGSLVTSTSSTSSPVQSSSPPIFESPPAVTSVSSAFAFPSPPLFASMQAPVQASAHNTSKAFSFGDSGKTASTFARPDIGFSSEINPQPTTTVVFGTTPCNVSLPFGATQDFGKTSSVFASSTTPKNPFSSVFPRFGVDYLPGSPSNVFGPNPPTTTPVSGPFGFNGPAPTFSSNNTIGSRYPPYAPTPDDCDFRGHRNMMSSIAGSNAYQHKSHEELRWEDYKHGDKGGVGFFPATHITPMGSRPNPYQHKSHEELRWEDYKLGDKGGLSPAFFSPSTALPSIFSPQSTTDHPQRTGCSACGATSSSSASGFSGFNVATNPPLAATSLPGLFFPTAGSCPMLFGTTSLAAQGTTTTPAPQALMMFGTNLAAQGTTPAVQAYPVHGFILLPFAAMNLQ